MTVVTISWVDADAAIGALRKAAERTTDREDKARLSRVLNALKDASTIEIRDDA